MNKKLENVRIKMRLIEYTLDSVQDILNEMSDATNGAFDLGGEKIALCEWMHNLKNHYNEYAITVLENN